MIFFRGYNVGVDPFSICRLQIVTFKGCDPTDDGGEEVGSLQSRANLCAKKRSRVSFHIRLYKEVQVDLTPESRNISTVWGGRLCERFCNMFSESSTGSWAELQLLCFPSKQGELPENMLQNLLHNLPPQTVSNTT